MNKPFIDFPEAKNIVVSGDIHGDFRLLVHKCSILYGMTDTLIVVAGDCGFGFERPGYYDNIFKRCCKKLQQANNWVVFIRGNHDNPAYFDGNQVDYKRWKAVPDYTVIRACGHSILCVGGAISVDRTLRDSYHSMITTEDVFSPKDYWPEEPPVFDSAKLAAINEKCEIDVVITHTSPSFCERNSHQGLEDWAKRDQTLLDDVSAERKVMDRILAYLTEHHHPISCWYYGHFHRSWHCMIDNITYNMLDIIELREIWSK